MKEKVRTDTVYGTGQQPWTKSSRKANVNVSDFLLWVKSKCMWNKSLTWCKGNGIITKWWLLVFTTGSWLIHDKTLPIMYFYIAATADTIVIIHLDSLDIDTFLIRLTNVVTISTCRQASAAWWIPTQDTTTAPWARLNFPKASRLLFSILDWRLWWSAVPVLILDTVVKSMLKYVCYTLKQLRGTPGRHGHLKSAQDLLSRANKLSNKRKFIVIFTLIFLQATCWQHQGCFFLLLCPLHRKLARPSLPCFSSHSLHRSHSPVIWYHEMIYLENQATETTQRNDSID